MKIFTSILIVIALALAIYNTTLIDFKKPFEGNNSVALISAIASLCAVFILIIFLLSKKIEEKLKNQ